MILTMNNYLIGMFVQVANNGNCANASNPYHQCTQACFQKTTKGTKHHHAASNGKKTTAAASNGRRSSTVATTTTTVVAGCPKASNPYHKCDANCNKTSSSNSGQLLLSMVWSICLPACCYLISLLLSIL
jgi:hypothetical protein